MRTERDLEAKFTRQAAMKLREGSQDGRRSRGRRRSSALGTLMFSGQVNTNRLLQLMPKDEDSTSMWWADGFPDVVKSARWVRVIRSGEFAFALDTETLGVPHFGALSTDTAWDQLPAAKLEATIHAGGRTYHCTGAKPWTRYTGPRLIESGRFFQRGDITNLIFKSERW